MKTTPLAHVCICVEDMEKSIAFYKEAFDLEPINTVNNPEFNLTWVGKKPVDGQCPNFVELRTENGHTGAYDKGFASNHFALLVSDAGEYLKRHEKMGIVDYCIPNGPHFVHDIDGYSIEVMDEKIVMSLF
jgi:lactoylglutathione lyase